jgi:hypothetical protein
VTKKLEKIFFNFQPLSLLLETVREIMSSVTLELVASVRNPFASKKRKIIIELKEIISIKTLLLDVGFKESELEFLIPILNGTRTTHDQLLSNNDHIWITLPIGGG